ncbi:hypothetical protein [Sandarakinorhabdus sp.]|uniref:hypothetical protein n=1 Tax=Sandarakinorhabdus sp. TaxID=1916663 RepID=UPI00333F6803
MRDALIAILLCGVAVAACEDGKAVKPSEPAAITAEAGDKAEDSGTDTSRTVVQFSADSDSGEVALRLPGGISGKLQLPGGVIGGEDARFDLDGVGRYPGAKLTSVNIKAQDSEAGGDARVALGFSAPGSADAVADWYEKAFAAKGRSVQRTGTSLRATTADGDAMVITLRDGPAGTARGEINIRGSNG